MKRPSPTIVSPTVTSFGVPAALRDHLRALAAQRRMAVDALVQEILQWGLADERMYELDPLGQTYQVVYPLSPEVRQQLIQAAIRHGSGERQSELLCAIVRAWFTAHAPERDLPQEADPFLWRPCAF